MIALLCFFLTLFASPFKSKSRLLLNGAIDHRHLVRIVHGTGCLGSERILQLRLHEGRAVETKERLTRFHRIAGRIDMQFLDVPLRPRSARRASYASMSESCRSFWTCRAEVQIPFEECFLRMLFRAEHSVSVKLRARRAAYICASVGG
jgi:hypothetical protein